MTHKERKLKNIKENITIIQEMIEENTELLKKTPEDYRLQNDIVYLHKCESELRVMMKKINETENNVLTL